MEAEKLVGFGGELLDPDMDGKSTVDEYNTGTDHLDAQSVLRIDQISDVIDQIRTNPDSAYQQGRWYPRHRTTG